MFSGLLMKIEHRKLVKRAAEVTEKLEREGLTPEVIIEMQKLQRAVDALEKKTNDELKRLGLN